MSDEAGWRELPELPYEQMEFDDLFPSVDKKQLRKRKEETPYEPEDPLPSLVESGWFPE